MTVIHGDSDTSEYFKKQILNFIRPRQNINFKLQNPLGIKLLTRLRVALSYLKEGQFKNNFQDFMDLLCSCGNSIESTIYFFLHCASFTFQRKTLLNKICSYQPNILAKKEFLLLKHSYLENQVFETHLIKKLLMLPLASYYQQVF